MEVIEGNSREVIKQMQDEMMEFARQLEFEKRSLLKKKWKFLKLFAENRWLSILKLQKSMFLQSLKMTIVLILIFKNNGGRYCANLHLEINNKLDKTRSY